MSLKNNITPFFVASLFTFLSIGVHAQSPSSQRDRNKKMITREEVGGSNGGGSYEHINSKLLLEVVSKELADDIAQMNPKTFDNFPKYKNIGKKEFEQIIRNVVAQPDDYLKRDNKEKKREGLMFNYEPNFCDEHGCGPRIIAMKPFYDAYKGDPVKQWIKDPKKSEVYLAKKKDLREKLLHEAGHLIDIGTTPETDHHGDEFAERIEKAMRNNYLLCEYKDWWLNPALNYAFFHAYFINLATGERSAAYTEIFLNEEVTSELKESRAESARDIVSRAAEVYKSEGHVKNTDLDKSLQARPALFSIKNDELFWQGEPYPFSNQTIQTLTNIRQYTEFIRLNIKTGEGTLSFPYPGRKDPSQKNWSPENETYLFTEVKLKCVPKNFAIDLNFN